MDLTEELITSMVKEVTGSQQTVLHREDTGTESRASVGKDENRMPGSAHKLPDDR